MKGAPDPATNARRYTVGGLSLFRRSVAAILFLLALVCCGHAQAMTLIHLQADSVTFYYDRFLVEADGHVRLTASDGTSMTGDAFSMDLKLNRFMLAGHVHMQDSQGAQDGAALADFIAQSRVYFVPITSEPDRWTFLNGDFAHPAKGREMPGDTFFFPDLSRAKPFLYAKSAVIGSDQFVRFGPGKVDLGSGLGLFVPEPSFYVNFSTNQHLAENSLAGANFDATYQMAGSANWISALHFRYDIQDKGYASLEQHWSGQKAYAVFSVNPATQPSRFWNLVLSDQPSDAFQLRTFTQLHTVQHGLTTPYESGQFTVVQATQALRRSFLQASYTFTNYSLLNPNAPTWDPLHPSTLQLGLQTFDERVGRLPLYEHINAGFGFQHSSYGVQNFGGTRYDTIWQHNLGLTLYSSQFKLGHSYIASQNYYLNAVFSKQRQWNSLPHYTDTTDTVLSLSRMFTNHWSSYLQYEVNNVGDYYGALQSLAYPGFTPVVNGVPYPGYQAFRGLATFRTLSLGVNYLNAGDFSAYVLLRAHDDFPKPIPFFFTFAPEDILGRRLVQNYIGQPPYDATADVRVRINPHMSLDLQRSYYFNYSALRWSPNFVFQVTQ
jgi:hypothetical protein